jgi:hypothetical protein
MYPHLEMLGAAVGLCAALPEGGAVLGILVQLVIHVLLKRQCREILSILFLLHGAAVGLRAALLGGAILGFLVQLVIHVMLKGQCHEISIFLHQPPQ